MLIFTEEVTEAQGVCDFPAIIQIVKKPRFEQQHGFRKPYSELHCDVLAEELPELK